MLRPAFFNDNQVQILFYWPNPKRRWNQLVRRRSKNNCCAFLWFFKNEPCTLKYITFTLIMSANWIPWLVIQSPHHQHFSQTFLGTWLLALLIACLVYYPHTFTYQMYFYKMVIGNDLNCIFLINNSKRTYILHVCPRVNAT